MIQPDVTERLLSKNWKRQVEGAVPQVSLSKDRGRPATFFGRIDLERWSVTLRIRKRNMLPNANAIHDGVILAARLFLATLFLIFGWRKVRDYSGTVSQMVQDGLPLPVMATAVAIFMELPVAFTVAVGALTRPAALLMALYTLGTSLVEHRYWRTTGAGQLDSMEAFYKNLSIIAAFLLLYLTGAGKYSIDALWSSATP